MIDKRIAAALATAVSLAIPAEGLRQYAYRDPVGILTVCYGETNGVQMRKYSEQECRAMLDSSMLKAIDEVNRCQPNLPENVLAAFGDAAYNIGSKVACDVNKSTAARLLKAKDYKGACSQLIRWNKATVAGNLVELPGLTKRREKERQVCLTGL